MKKMTIKGIMLTTGITLAVVAAALGSFFVGSSIAKNNNDAQAVAKIQEEERQNLAKQEAERTAAEKEAEAALKEAQAAKEAAQKEAAEAKAAQEAAEKAAKAEKEAAEKAIQEAAKKAEEAQRAKEEAERKAEEAKKDVWATVPANYTLYSTTDNLKIRQWATTDSDILGVINKDQAVNIIGDVTCNGRIVNWAKVNVNGTTGYVCTDWLTSTVPQKPDVWGEIPANCDARATYEGVAVRQLATTNSNVIATLSKDEEVHIAALVTLNGNETRWVRIDLGGRNGYICKDDLEMRTSPIFAPDAM